MPDWVIAGEPKGSFPKVKGVYEIRDSRKGVFEGKIIDVRGDFADVEVLSGKIHWVSKENNLFNPDPEVVSIRDILVYLIPRITLAKSS
jgi:hypothetical protein